MGRPNPNPLTLALALILTLTLTLTLAPSLTLTLTRTRTLTLTVPGLLYAEFTRHALVQVREERRVPRGGGQGGGLGARVRVWG